MVVMKVESVLSTLKDKVIKVKAIQNAAHARAIRTTSQPHFTAWAPVTSVDLSPFGPGLRVLTPP